MLELLARGTADGTGAVELTEGENGVVGEPTEGEKELEEIEEPEGEKECEGEKTTTGGEIEQELGVESELENTGVEEFEKDLDKFEGELIGLLVVRDVV